MVDVQTLQTISIVIASAGILVAAIYYVLQLRHQNRMRQTDLVMRLYSTFGGTEFQKAWQRFITTKYTSYDDFVKKYGSWAPEAGIFLEGIGVLLRRNLIDIGLVDDLFSGPIKIAWERFKPIAEDARKQLNYPEYAEYTEYLYNEMKKREQQLAKAK
jgi:hypothetical protein